MSTSLLQNEQSEHSVNSAAYMNKYVEEQKDKFPVDEERSTIYSGNRDPEETKRWINFKKYSLWNAIRFAIIAAVVCASNYVNQHQIEGYRGYCCNCYYIALDSQYYGIDNNYRIDWSYCMPACVNCNYCKQHYNNTASESFKVTNQACPADGYNNRPKHKVDLDWDKNCPDNISITTLGIFLKDYRVYGIAIIIIVVLYIILMAAFVFCCQSYAGVNSGASLLVYNVIVSINAVYSMFKPMQYYHKTITQNTPTHMVCEVDTIDELTEDLITYCVYGSFAFILVQWIMGVIGCIFTRKAMGSKMKGSIGRVPYKIRMAYICFEKAMIVLAVALGAIFYLTLMYASGVMINRRVKEHRGVQDAWKIGVILVVDLLSISSCFDIFFFSFCKHTCNNYFGQLDDKEQKTYRQMWGKSIDDSNSNSAPYSVPLINNDEKESQL